MSGSLQLRLYRLARRRGVERDVASQRVGIGMAEARLIDEGDAKDPPAAECYRLTPGMARHYVGELADTPLGTAMVERLMGE